MSDPDVYGTLDCSKYPFGVKHWELFGDHGCGCNSTEAHFNTCSNDQFNCKSGQCVDIEHRCDGHSDCLDSSGRLPFTLCNLVAKNCLF